MGIGSDDSEPYFAGTLNSVSSQASYVYNIARIRGQIGGFPATTSTVRRALSSGFILDLMALTPDDIVKKYGTHFVSHACVGLAVKTLYSAFVDARDSEKVSKAYKGDSLLWSHLLPASWVLTFRSLLPARIIMESLSQRRSVAANSLYWNMTRRPDCWAT